MFQFCHKKNSADNLTSGTFGGFFTNYYITVTFQNFTRGANVSLSV